VALLENQLKVGSMVEENIKRMMIIIILMIMMMDMKLIYYII